MEDNSPPQPVASDRLIQPLPPEVSAVAEREDGLAGFRKRRYLECMIYVSTPHYHDSTGHRPRTQAV